MPKLVFNALVPFADFLIFLPNASIPSSPAISIVGAISSIGCDLTIGGGATGGTTGGTWGGEGGAYNTMSAFEEDNRSSLGN